MAVEHSSAAAWTPIRVRKVKLGVERNLGISPKSLKKEKKLKVGNKIKKEMSKLKPNGGRVMGMRSLFEGASHLMTKAKVKPNPYVTNLLATQDQLLGNEKGYVIGQSEGKQARPGLAQPITGTETLTQAWVGGGRGEQLEPR